MQDTPNFYSSYTYIITLSKLQGNTITFKNGDDKQTFITKMLPQEFQEKRRILTEQEKLENSLKEKNTLSNKIKM